MSKPIKSYLLGWAFRLFVVGENRAILVAWLGRSFSEFASPFLAGFTFVTARYFTLGLPSFLGFLFFLLVTIHPNFASPFQRLFAGETALLRQFLTFNPKLFLKLTLE